ncbi:MAG: transposase, partial [Methylocella sp.]
MLSTIVFCEDKPTSAPGRDLAEVLARTLASLVTAKVAGLLGDVRIAGPAGKGLSLVANHAGCALIEADNEADWLCLALQAARGPNIFLLRCGRAPEAGFVEEAGDFLVKN